MKLETLKISELNPADYNPRTITKEEFEGLKDGARPQICRCNTKKILEVHSRW